jgi:tRNA1(Val) A37 N6-methylase TrmN6
MPDITVDSLFNGQLQVKQERLGYRFSIDAVILAYYAGKVHAKRVVDLGTGCGIIPLILGHRGPTNHIIGVEIQEALANIAIENVADNNMSNHVDILLGDVKTLTPADIKGPVDLVLANPPYYKVHEGRLNPNPQRAVARHEIKVTLFDIVETAWRLLQEKGRFLSIFQTERMVDLLSKMRQVGLEPKMIRIIQTKDGIPGKLFLVEGEKGGAPGLVMPPPLIIAMKNKAYSHEVAAMFLP